MLTQPVYDMSVGRAGLFWAMAKGPLPPATVLIRHRLTFLMVVYILSNKSFSR